MRTLLLMTAALVLGACRPPAEAPLGWDFGPRPIDGEVHVLPVAGTWDEPRVRLDTYVGAPVPWSRERLRRTRTLELGLVPEAVAWSLPGAVNGQLGDAHDAIFKPARYHPGDRGRVESALRGSRDLDQVLQGVARSMGGQGTLFTWVTALDGEPLSAEGFPGEVLETPTGPIVVDHYQEHYRVYADVGMALVASDGEVVLRYSDHFEAMLSERNDPERVGRDLANALAGEVAKVWPVDPRLRFGEPPPRR